MASSRAVLLCASVFTIPVIAINENGYGFRFSNYGDILKYIEEIDSSEFRGFTNKELGVIIMTVSGLGIFAGGNIPMAILMAGGAILFTMPDIESKSQARQLGETISNFYMPPEVEAIEIVNDRIQNKD